MFIASNVEHFQRNIKVWKKVWTNVSRFASLWLFCESGRCNKKHLSDKSYSLYLVKVATYLEVLLRGGTEPSL